MRGVLEQKLSSRKWNNKNVFWEVYRSVWMLAIILHIEILKNLIKAWNQYQEEGCQKSEY